MVGLIPIIYRGATGQSCYGLTVAFRFLQRFSLELLYHQCHPPANVIVFNISFCYTPITIFLKLQAVCKHWAIFVLFRRLISKKYLSSENSHFHNLLFSFWVSTFATYHLAISPSHTTTIPTMASNSPAKKPNINHTIRLDCAAPMASIWRCKAL